MSAKFPNGGVGHDLTYLVVKILCHDSTGCDKMDSYFGIEADTTIDIVYEYDLDEDSF